MNTSNSKLPENKAFMEFDGLVGLPNGVKPDLWNTILEKLTNI